MAMDRTPTHCESLWQYMAQENYRHVPFKIRRHMFAFLLFGGGQTQYRRGGWTPAGRPAQAILKQM